MPLDLSTITDFMGAREIASGRGGSCDAFTLGDSTRTFLVRLRDPLPSDKVPLDESFALFHAGVPALRSAHPTRPGLFVLNKTASQATAPCGNLWIVTVSYSPAPRADLPWNEPAIYSWGQQSTELVCDFDVVTNQPIMNSAKCPFDPAVTATRYEATLTVSKNVLGFNAAVPLAYVGAVNKSSFYGAAAGYCMCVGIPAQMQIYQNEQGGRTPYWSVSYQFSFRNTIPWQAKVLDAGYMELRDGKHVPCLLAGGREPTSPVPLDGEGKQVEDPENFTPNYLDFKIYPEKNFYDLGV